MCSPEAVGWPHVQVGESALPSLDSQGRCGPLSVLIHVNAARALLL